MTTNRAARRRGLLPLLGGFSFLAALSACAPGGEDGSAPGELDFSRTPAPEDGEGSVRIVPDDPVVAATWGSWTVEWTAGPAGLPEGAGIVLQVSPFWGWSPPQTGRPGRPGFTTVRSSNPSVALAVSDGAVPMTVVASVERGALAAGETVSFVYGDSLGGGPGSLARADIYAEKFEELLIKTDGNGDGFFVPVPDQPTLEILPQAAAYLAVASPAVVRPGDRFEVHVRALDRSGNLAPLGPGSLDLLLRPLTRTPGVPVGPPVTLLASAGTSNSGWDGTLDVREPGLYRVSATWHGGDDIVLRGENDLILVEEGSPFEAILWGDIHCHSALSDGTGAPEDLFEYARDVAGLDVVSVTDHDAHGLYPLVERGGWERIVEATREAYEPGRLVTLLGYEWTSWDWGHRNVYFPGLEGEVFEYRSEESDTPPELWEKIAPFGGMTIPHHPGGGPVPVDWTVPSPEERETVVEICSIHGSSEALGVERGIYRPVPGAMVRDALNLGHRLGILASGDTHDGHPGRRTAGAPANGLAAFRARERTREAVWGALRERRVYGTSGPRVLLATEWGGALPGSFLERAPAGALRVRVVAPEPIEAIELVGPDGTLETSYGGGRTVTKRFLEEGPPTGVAWFYVRVVLANGELAWESPYWLREVES